MSADTPVSREEFEELQRRCIAVESWVACLLEMLINKNILTQDTVDRIMALGYPKD